MYAPRPTATTATRHPDRLRALVLRHAAIGATLAALAVSACDGAPEAAAPDPAPPAPAAIQRNDGDQQRAAVGMPLPEPVSVRVLTSSGQPVADVPVSFSVTSGGGWVPQRQPVLTDASGTASAAWYMGPATTGTHLLMAASPAGAVTFRADVLELEPGETYSGAGGYIELHVGTLPLIISAGRGGTLAPGDIPERADGERDPHLYTIELVNAIQDAFRERGGGMPSVLISRLERSRMDPDVELPAGAQPGTPAERAWREYHGFLTALRGQVASRYGRGLYLDVHGPADAGPRIELGYLLTPDELKLNNALLDQLTYVAKSSIRSMAMDNHTVLSFIVRGPASLGALFEARGLAALPSPGTPHPDGDGYVPGGLSTLRYGSIDGSPVSAIRLQLPLAGVRETDEERRRFAAAFVAAMDAYYTEYFGAALIGTNW